MDEEKLIFAVNVIPEFDDFLAALKLNNAGLGAQLFKSVYDHIFVASADLRREYDRYYCVEYPSLAEYLECAHDVYLDQDDLEKNHILTFKQDNGLMNDAYDDNILETVIDSIRKLESEYEN